MRADLSKKGISAGIDVTSIKRLCRAAKRKPFLERVFTEGELGYSFARKDPYRHLAGRFAAKEACCKALGTRMGRGLNLKDIEVVATMEGRPGIVLHSGAKRMLGGRHIFLSIAYSAELAVAFVAVEAEYK